MSTRAKVAHLKGSVNLVQCVRLCLLVENEQTFCFLDMFVDLSLKVHPLMGALVFSVDDGGIGLVPLNQSSFIMVD